MGWKAAEGSGAGVVGVDAGLTKLDRRYGCEQCRSPTGGGGGGALAAGYP